LLLPDFFDAAEGLQGKSFDHFKSSRLLCDFARSNAFSWDNMIVAHMLMTLRLKGVIYERSVWHYWDERVNING
jgi:hypothetical protein